MWLTEISSAAAAVSISPTSPSAAGSGIDFRYKVFPNGRCRYAMSRWGSRGMPAPSLNPSPAARSARAAASRGRRLDDLTDILVVMTIGTVSLCITVDTTNLVASNLAFPAGSDAFPRRPVSRGCRRNVLGDRRGDAPGDDDLAARLWLPARQAGRRANWDIWRTTSIPTRSSPSAPPVVRIASALPTDASAIAFRYHVQRLWPNAGDPLVSYGVRICRRKSPLEGNR